MGDYEKILKGITDAHSSGADTVSKIVFSMNKTLSEAARRKMLRSVCMVSGLRPDDVFHPDNCVFCTALVASIYIYGRKTHDADVPKIKNAWRKMFRKERPSR